MTDSSDLTEAIRKEAEANQKMVEARRNESTAWIDYRQETDKAKHSMKAYRERDNKYRNYLEKKQQRLTAQQDLLQAKREREITERAMLRQQRDQNS